MFNPPDVAAAAHRADGDVHAARLAVRRARARSCCAASSTIRRRAAWAASPATPGLFSTAADLVALLPHDARRRRARRRAHPVAADGRCKMTSPATPAGMASVRGLGWDIDTSYSSNRGELFPVGFVRPHRIHGHVDLDRPGHETLRHPPVEPRAPGRQGRRDAGARARRDRRRVGAAATAGRAGAARPSAGPAPTSAPAGTAPRPGRRGGRPDAERHRRAAGRRLHAARGQAGRPRHEPHRAARATGEATIDLHRVGAKGVTLVALFSPEHGIRGIARREGATSSTDEKTGLPIYSLYGDTRRPDRRDAQGHRHDRRSTCRTSARASTPTPRRWAT